MAVIDIATYKPKQDERYFMDCNVWMYMFYTNGGYAADLVYSYSRLAAQIINLKATIYVTDLLISEFTNTYIQAEFHRLASLKGWNHSKRFFKQNFKNTQEYSDILKEIRIIINRQLLPITTPIDSDFIGADIDAMFDDPATFDFNDRYYSMEMRKRRACIITNDADFSDVKGCDIITKNQNLLSIA